MSKPHFHIAYKWLIFSVTAIGVFMSTLDGGIVNIALPVMAKDLGVTLERIQWVVTVYLLTTTCFLPVFGKLSDMYSRKYLYLTGFLLFGVGSLLAAFAHSLAWMIFSRAVQGLGASAMISNCQAIIAKAFHGKDRGRALGGIGAMVAIGFLAGPTLGGLLIEQWGWQSVFWINVPISLFGIWRGIQIIPLFMSHQKVKMDFTGAVCFILFSFCFLYALDEGSTQSWTSALIMGAFALSALFFVGFYMREQKSPAPFIGLSIFKIQAISYGCIVSVLGFIALNCNSILFPFYMADILHLTPVQMSLLMLPFPAALAVCSPLSGWLSERYSARLITTVGFGFLIIGASMFVCIGTHPSFAYIVAAQMIMGCGSGTFQAPNNNTIISAAPADRLGMVVSLSALARNMGAVMGIALSVLIFSTMKRYLLAHAAPQQEAFMSAYQASMTFCICCCVLAGYFSAAREKRKKRKKQPRGFYETTTA
ncbi:MFS transporter [Candidatus Avelusimicrobium aviculae]|uniref:MFS transporter n=1 Tax=Candidatus Avelusimicrobium aviculae TaxID=3416206 RepID=UPI003D0C499F